TQAEEEKAEEKKAQAQAAKASNTRQKQSQTQTQSRNNAGSIPSKKTLENRITQIIKENDDKSKLTDLGQIGNELNRIFKNFDVRYYGRKGGCKYKYLKDFVKDIKSLQLDETEGNRVYVSLKK
uniref:OST-HTH/LOTUS domain-containing protein n=1 Tax=Aminicella lysinilytica TaxID=433323 RepID=UPI0026EA70E5